MVQTKHISLGVTDMPASYDSTAKNVELILKKRYGMRAADAERAVRCSPLRSVFEENVDMAAHTSNEAWARDVYEYWKKHCAN